MTGTATHSNGAPTDTVVCPLPSAPASCPAVAMPSFLCLASWMPFPAPLEPCGRIPSHDSCPAFRLLHLLPLWCQAFDLKKSARKSTRAGATIEQMKRSAVPDFAPSDIFVAKLEPKEVLRNLSPAGMPPVPRHMPACRKSVTHAAEHLRKER